MYRKQCVIHTEKMRPGKASGTSVHVGSHPSTVGIARLKLDKDRDPRRKGPVGKGKADTRMIKKMQGRSRPGTAFIKACFCGKQERIKVYQL